MLLQSRDLSRKTGSPPSKGSPEQVVASQSVAVSPSLAARSLCVLCPMDLAFPVLTDTPVPFKDDAVITFPRSHRDQVNTEPTTTLSRIQSVTKSKNFFSLTRHASETPTSSLPRSSLPRQTSVSATN